MGFQTISFGIKNTMNINWFPFQRFFPNIFIYLFIGIGNKRRDNHKRVYQFFGTFLSKQLPFIWKSLKEYKQKGFFLLVKNVVGVLEASVNQREG